MQLERQNSDLNARERDIVAREASSGGPSREDFQKMARRRFQGGSVFLRGTRDPVWVGRWREDVIGSDQKIKRVGRKEILGTKKDFPTKKLALRELGIRLAPINSVGYRALRVATFAEFAARRIPCVRQGNKPSPLPEPERGGCLEALRWQEERCGDRPHYGERVEVAD